MGFCGFVCGMFYKCSAFATDKEAPPVLFTEGLEVKHEEHLCEGSARYPPLYLRVSLMYTALLVPSSNLSISLKPASTDTLLC